MFLQGSPNSAIEKGELRGKKFEYRQLLAIQVRRIFIPGSLLDAGSATVYSNIHLCCLTWYCQDSANKKDQGIQIRVIALRYQQALVRHMPTRETGWKEYLKKV